MSASTFSHSGPVLFELCAQDVEACAAAATGGADRIELCTRLEVGGLTPSPALVAGALETTDVPVHVLVRPSAESFVFSAERFAALRDTLLRYRHTGVAGFVLGVLTAEGSVDVEHTRDLVELAHPLPVSFHRAFDETRSLPEALEAVIAAGCHRVLTSGGAHDVVAGAETLAALVRQAEGRIALAAGGGLRLQNAALVARQTQAPQFHASLSHDTDRAAQPELADRVAAMVRILRAAGSMARGAADPRYSTAGMGVATSGSRAGRWP